MPLHFVVDEPLDADTGQTVTLTGAEAHHAATVRRVRVGETVTLGDGAGVWLEGACELVAAREVLVRVTNREEVPRPSVRIELVQALAKGDRDELAVQASTELGVDVITPWQAARSVSRWDAAKREKGVTRWRQIAREAGKQAHRAWLPEVGGPLTTAQLCERAAATRMLVLEPTAALRLSEWMPDPTDCRDIAIVVGPEGGIDAGELTSLEAAGATLVRLGEHVLRTSTAGPAAIAVLSSTLGRW
ncbi:MAG TPA: 16S rRNA (uracil(1498)-N(3))-methyltransferase [Microbacterium sp.]|uniref:16S rRNA (uracil(1498)-N(3))-methyltransferase n=1 Tax=Microbacterium TaxID=33882 RepID=UPI000C5FD185|nr:MULTISPECIES: 16S rRNA (uracil(1498)-N(3))-methyltransferase [Microbacterium]MEC8762073.1 16S rRNA (uracil(1498)-N(3))-methyltransferase [Actinomycetota bacterium]MBU20079.1 16S rRNA (uracil(1498)-N(3))-methyltransferase [Microbacterium sp.]MCC4268410.1 16S rRNA (uracil(1498)-N(3))-methyltransferase [Microbacterium schleiferi]HAM13469.1 16S rRNA (uracil(1498)-N(3))-methyltransferase [Microbacterium sp.]HBS09188.1 16S rRNA (uracil(1498)-N(3))-methyltransferase [Microbacterium sp.]